MYRTQEAIVQNLRDAGCDPETIECFLAQYEKGSTKEVLKLLALHRRGLLNALHEEQKKIDCLDYLVYHFQK